MRIGELSRRSGVSVPTIKYYRRMDLLPPGAPTAPNQASYDDDHVARLRLIRALLDVGGLSVAGAREVLAAVDAGDSPLHELLGIAHQAVTHEPVGEPGDRSTSSAEAEVADLVRDRGWQVAPGSPGLARAAEAVQAIRALGQEDLLACMGVYADAAELVADRELDVIAARGEPARMVEGVVTGTVFGEVLLTALRLLAQENASARLLGGNPPGGQGVRASRTET